MMGIFGNSEDRSLERQRRLELDGLRNQVRNLNESIEEARKEVKRLSSLDNQRCAPKWEYLIAEDLDESTLDECGSRGWQLVNAASYTTGFGFGGNSSMTVHFKYVFKRPVASTGTPETQQADAKLYELELEQYNLNEQIAAY